MVIIQAGLEGPQGPNGANGADGLPGVAGVNGANGLDGANGVDGVQGERGPRGYRGAPGGGVVAGPPLPALVSVAPALEASPYAILRATKLERSQGQVCYGYETVDVSISGGVSGLAGEAEAVAAFEAYFQFGLNLPDYSEVLGGFIVQTDPIVIVLASRLTGEFLSVIDENVGVRAGPYLDLGTITMWLGSAFALGFDDGLLRGAITGNFGGLQELKFFARGAANREINILITGGGQSLFEDSAGNSGNPIILAASWDGVTFSAGPV